MSQRKANVTGVHDQLHPSTVIKTFMLSCNKIWEIVAKTEVRDAGLSCKRSGNAGQGHPPLPLPPRSRPLFDTDHPTALKRRHVTNIKDQLSFNRYNLLAFRGFLLYLADLHVRAIPEIRKNLDTY